MISLLQRNIATILILGAIAAGACACGASRAAPDARSGASAATGPTAVVGSNSPASPASKVSYATLALGEAINLRRSDLPGMIREAPEGEGVGSPARKVCGRTASLIEEPGGFHSPEFTGRLGRHAEALRSAVRLAPSAAAAAHYVATNASPSFLACYERYLQSTTRPVARPVAISVSALPSPLPGVSSFAWRVMRRPSHPITLRYPVYIDFLGFAAGRVEVALATVHGSKPFPAANERRLLSLLLSRARANEL